MRVAVRQQLTDRQSGATCEALHTLKVTYMLNIEGAHVLSQAVPHLEGDARAIYVQELVTARADGVPQRSSGRRDGFRVARDARGPVGDR